MIRHPQCLTCGHNKSNHRSFVCLDCMEEMGYRFLYEKDGRHKYIPDNLGHIERLAKARKLI